MSVLQAFADRLKKHPARQVLERPFVCYVGNQPAKAWSHFYGLRETKPDLIGIAIYDRLDKGLTDQPGLLQMMWKRREIENYLCFPEALLAYATASAQGDQPGSIFAAAEAQERRQLMNECIADLVPPVALRNHNDPWWRETKASDEFLDRLFEMFFGRLGLPNLMRRGDYHALAELIPPQLIDLEVAEKLDAIVEVARTARPVES